MKKQLITLIAMLLPIMASADAVEIDGIYYNLNSKTKTAEVTFGSWNKYTDNKDDGRYTGEVVIPQSVKFGDEEYSVTSIGKETFRLCNGLTSVTIPGSVISISEAAFELCKGLISVEIPNSVTSIGKYAFFNCSSLTSVNIPNSLIEIADGVFSNCSSLTSVDIPTSVTRIGQHAFSSCSSLKSVTLPDDITYIGDYAFNCKVYTKHKTKTLFSLWRPVGLAGIPGNGIIDIETGKVIERPFLSQISSTQTSLELKIHNKYSEYIYTSNYDMIDDKIVITGERPDCRFNVELNILCGDLIYSIKKDFYTKKLKPTINSINATVSSVEVEASYIEGDAVVTSEYIELNNQKIEGNTAYIKGLDPNIKLKVVYNVTIAYGIDNQNTETYTTSKEIKTESLNMSTAQPKIISVGNVIVAAETNLNDDEENVGFEWRRTDWTDDFASNTGGAALFEGRMEGYIRNMNAEKLWKYRPYYLSNSGTYYYGDWVGIDPSNTSYFEPTVHTYEKTVIEGNTALVKGYALTGTDKITVQGFKYWRRVSKARGVSPVSVPSDAMTIEASGQVMTASLTDLDYGATYNYLSFVTTSEGETFYGELKEFTTDEAEKIGDVNSDGEENAEDIVAITNFIMGKADDVMQEKADVNGDGVVDIADVVKIANIIMGK